ncbi:MAG TPA: lipid IV(A) 3-deoxy-D-manno-octulosonic acid transferase [Xanthomonadaceae bacterium]|nr:lipid IV(A) 3-deoxy-D-manno-octulosonic acid transferase [Xanthomonadaceae bacterium]
MPLSLLQRLLRGAYACVMYALVPAMLYHLVWRGLRDREYFRRWSERFGWYGTAPMQPSIWVHAVSVGEVIAAAPLVDALRARHPDTPLLVTTTTPTGAAQVLSRWKGAVGHLYFPYDLSGAARRFLAHAKPRIAIVMETEIWPNIYFAVGRANVPLMLVNARLSQRSLSGYRLALPLIRMALARVDAIAAQSQADAQRLLRAGAPAERLRVTGNLKFDLRLPEGLDALARERRAAWGSTRPVWIAASTHEGEEASVLDAYARLRERFPTLLLLWAPRRPARFAGVASACMQRGWRTRRRSAGVMADADTDCFVIDSIGELMGFYAASDVAFVGGSLQAIGGHNVLEPAAVAVPTVVGPHTANFTEAIALLRDAGALLQVDHVEGLARALADLLADPVRCKAMGEAGRAVVERERGALARTLVLIEACLPVSAA